MATNRPTSLGTLDILPSELIAHVNSYCLPTALGLFARASRKAEEKTAFFRLLAAAVNAEPESYEQADETRLAVMAILKRHPELLFRRGTVTDHFGRKIKASPYRLLLGAGDTWALKQVHEAIIPNIKDGEAQAQVHFQAQFPNCPWPLDPTMGEEMLYDARNKEQVAQVTAQLQTIEAKITADPCTNGLSTLEETKKAVAELCQIYSPKEGEVIRTGLHFPLAVMREIYKVHDARVRAVLNGQPNSWSATQLAYFSREVFGPAEAASTNVDGQCIKYGLNTLDMKKGPDRRDGLFCRHPKGIPQALTPIAAKLGRTMFVDPYDGESCFLTGNAGYFDWYNKNGGCVLVGGGGRWRPVGRVENLWRTKAETYGSCYAATRREVNTPS